MPTISRKFVFRSVATVPLLVCVFAWVWSYMRIAGVGRVQDDIWIAESSRGKLLITRTRGIVWNDAVAFDHSPFPVWGTYHAPCTIADFAAIAQDAYIGRRFLGFGFGREPKEDPNRQWVLSDDGLPVLSTQPIIDPPEPTQWVFGSPRPPPPVHAHFAVVIPWWSLTLAALWIALLVWRKTKPAAMTIAPTS